MAFDITSVLGDLARTDPDGQKRIEYIPLHLIDKNPLNYYSMDGIEELAANIEAVGLLEPLIVKEMGGGRYMLLSGHRRRAALQLIAEDKGNYPESMSEPVPCIVEPAAELPGIVAGSKEEKRARVLVEQLKLVFANADTRVLTSADQAFQTRQIRELLTELKALGFPLPGKLRDHVAAASGISATRVARLDVIDKGLKEPSLRQAWKDGTIGETAAYEIARRSEKAQRAAAASTGPKALGAMTTEQVSTSMDHYEKRAEEDQAARDNWNRVMTKAQPEEPKFDDRGRIEWDAKEYLAKRKEEDEAFGEMLDEIAEGFFRELAEAHSRQEGIEILKKKFGSNRIGGTKLSGLWYDCAPKGLRLRKRKLGDITRTWTDVYDMLSLDALYRVAQRQEVSAEDTGLQWQTGTPTEAGDYTVRSGIPDEEGPKTSTYRIIHWNGESWSWIGTGVPFADQVYRWVKLPEV